MYVASSVPSPCSMMMYASDSVDDFCHILHDRPPRNVVAVRLRTDVYSWDTDTNWWQQIIRDEDSNIVHHSVCVSDSFSSDWKVYSEEFNRQRWPAFDKQISSRGNGHLLPIWDVAFAEESNRHRLCDHKSAAKALSWCYFRSDLPLAYVAACAYPRSINGKNTAGGAFLYVDFDVPLEDLNGHYTNVFSSHEHHKNQLFIPKYLAMHDIGTPKDRAEIVLLASQGNVAVEGNEEGAIRSDGEQRSHEMLLNMLLSWLPIRQAFRMRTVSKALYNMPIKNYALSPIPALNSERWFLLLKLSLNTFPHRDRYEGGHCGFPSEFEIYTDGEKHSFPFPSKAEWPRMRTLPSPSHPSRHRRPSICSANGLVALCIGGPGGEINPGCSWNGQVVIINCLTASFELLPVTNPWDAPEFQEDWKYCTSFSTGAYVNVGDVADIFLAMDAAVGLEPIHYYVLLARPRTHAYWSRSTPNWLEGSFQVYDSWCGQWKITRPSTATAAGLAQLLHCQFFSLYREDYLRQYIIGFNVGRGRWFKTLLVSKGFNIFSLFKDGDHGTSSTFVKHVRGKLRMVVSEWSSLCCLTRVVEVSRDSRGSNCAIASCIAFMPHWMRCRGQAFTTAASDVVCVSFFPYDDGGEHLEPGTPSQHVVAYNMETATWYVLPLSFASFRYRCVGILQPRRILQSVKHL